MKRKSYKKLNKKGSLEISITAVVVLILAIVMLGLGLGFIRSFFGGAVSQLGEITNSLDEQTRSELLQSPSQITFQTSRITVEGREKDLPFGVRNVRSNELQLAVHVDCFDAIGAAAKAGVEGEEDWIVFETFDTVNLEGGKSDVLPLKVQVDAAAIPTIYKCELDLNIIAAYDNEGNEIQVDENAAYAKKLFEIEYKK